MSMRGTSPTVLLILATKTSGVGAPCPLATNSSGTSSC